MVKGKDVRRTRIVATIGPASQDDETLAKLVDTGINVARLNYSHGTHEWRGELAIRIRRIASEKGRPVGILADLPGPKLRLGLFEGGHQLISGASVTLFCGIEEMVDADASKLPVPYAGLASELSAGDPVLLNDGIIRLEVKSTDADTGEVACVVIEGGLITQRKGMNLPGTVVKLPAVGPRDEDALTHAISIDVDFVAVSYVRDAADLAPAKRMLDAAGSTARLVAKIEHPSALEALDEILDIADVVMVARGDLGVEIPPEEVPLAQERIVLAARRRGMPVIVATQMLESMIEQARPTRAEVSDIANSIRHGATAVMLSAETAAGNHPIAALETMHRIAILAEAEWPAALSHPVDAFLLHTRAVALAGVELATAIGASRILVATERGNAARLVAAHTPAMPITAVTDSIHTLRQMTMISGVDSVLVTESERGSTTMMGALNDLLADGRLEPGDRVVAISGSPLAISGPTSTARLYRIDDDGHVIGDE
jgi:pyruvate kinase